MYRYSGIKRKFSDYWKLLVEQNDSLERSSEDQHAQQLTASAILSIPLTFISYFFFPLSDDITQTLLILIMWGVSIASLIMAYILSKTPRHYVGSYFLILGGIFIRIYYGIYFRSPLISQMVLICILAAAFLLKVKESFLLSFSLLTIVAVTLYLRYDYTTIEVGRYLFTSSILLISLALFNIRNANHMNKIHSQAELLVVKESERQQLLFQQFQAEFHARAIRGISHDLNTPLTIIKLQSQLIARKYDKQVLTFTEPIKKSVDRIADLVSKMNRFKQVSNNDKENWRVIDINTLVQKKANAFSEKYSMAKPLEINLSLSQTSLSCLGDETKLALSLEELLENAYVHSKQQAEISITAMSKKGDISLVVEDTGYGIPPEQLSNIFDLYSKGNQARNSWQSGPGLGLPLVKLIVNQHAGKISIQSEIDKGTFVEILLPQLQNT